MQAELMSIGAEILASQITDTNATYLSQRLHGLGIPVRRVTQVGDVLEDIVEVMQRALARVDLIVCTGGIGPTPDDLTREAVAELLGETMTVDPELETTLRAYFGDRGARMPEANLKQATLIPSARALRNRSGTAPGWWVDARGAIIVLMPGVPHEMKSIWEEEVEPQLRPLVNQVIAARSLKTQGLGESTIADMLPDLLSRPYPAVATYAKRDGVHVVITATGVDEAEVLAAVSAAEHEVRGALGDAIWGVDDDTLASTAARLLEEQRTTLNTFEVASAGALAAELLAAHSPCYLGGVVLGGTAPEADLTLHVGPAEASEGGQVTIYGCDVYLTAAGVELARGRASTASAIALPERAAMSALDLLRRFLLSWQSRG